MKEEDEERLRLDRYIWGRNTQKRGAGVMGGKQELKEQRDFKGLDCCPHLFELVYNDRTPVFLIH